MDASSAASATPQALLVLIAIPALGALVKWWMRGTERTAEKNHEALVKAIEQVAQNTAKAIEQVAQDVRRAVDILATHGKDIAVLQAQRESDLEEIRGLRKHVHEIANVVEGLKARISVLTREEAA